MIIGNLNHAVQNRQMPEKIRKCLNFAVKYEIETMKPGSYPVDGEIRLNIGKYETRDMKDAGTFEAHRKYIDVQVLLAGEELAEVGKTEEMQAGAYLEENDFMALKGKAEVTAHLTAGDFLVCYPEDAHRTGLAVQESCAVKKGVFKVPVFEDGEEKR